MSTSSRPSRPVDIPPRKHNSQPGLSTDAKGGITQASRRQQPPSANSLHDAGKVRPAVAALLAMTSIPPPRAQRSQRDKRRRQQQQQQQQQQQRVDGRQDQRARSGSSITSDELADEWKSGEDLSAAASVDSRASTSASLMATLLEPPTAHLLDSPCPSEHESATAADVRLKREGKISWDASRRRTGARSARTSSTTSQETNKSFPSSSPTSLRMSMSSDSVPSLLGGDAEEDGNDEEALSLASLSIGDPATPASFRCRSGSLAGERMRGEKKRLLSPPAMDSVVDHPLLAPSRTSNGAHASGPDNIKMRCENDRKGRDANADTSPRTSSPNASTRLSNGSRTLTNNSTNRPIAKQAQPLESSSLTSLKTTFKSNLTASFNVLASAARSFSNFTAPSLPPDDLLTRSLLAPNPSSAQQLPSRYPSTRFPSEMRPKPVDGLPEPALRRYLNPGVRVGTMSSTSVIPKGTDAEKHSRQTRTARSARTLTANTTDITQELRDDNQYYLERKGERSNRTNNFRDASNRASSTGSNNNNPCELNGNDKQDDYEDEMIPLEAYKRPISRPNTAKLPSSPSSPSTSSVLSSLLPTKAKHDENDACAGVHIRPREPRENSDFLRIVVLEMNMRRRGKLDGDAMGKARVWLPPRRERGVEVFGGVGGSSHVGDGDEGEARGRCVVGADASMVIPRRWMGEVPSY